MKHFLFILLIAAALTAGIFLPYLPGDYDYFAVGLSTVLQFVVFVSLLLLPIGLLWCLLDYLKRNSSSSHAVVCMRVTLVVTILIVLAAALGAFVSHNLSLAIVILITGVYIFSKVLKKTGALKLSGTQRFSIVPYYFIIIPLTVFVIRMTYLGKAKDQSTGKVIRNAEQLILDIEDYKMMNGHYPLSLHSTIEDYRPSVSGVPRFHYELNGEAYNIYFEQFSDIIGTEEIVMYNTLGEHEMTVHNQDLLRIAPSQISRGYHATADLLFTHWKVFYFD